MPIYPILFVSLAAMFLAGLAGHIWLLVGAVIITPAVLAMWFTDAALGGLRRLCRNSWA